MKRSLILIILCAISLIGVAQNNQAVKSGEPLILDIEKQLLPLDSLINKALVHSPFLKYDETMMMKSEEDLKLVKRDFYNNVNLFGNYSSGNQRFLIQGANDNNQQNNFVNGYRYGLNVSIPFSQVTNRGIRIRQKLAEMDALEYRMEQTQMGLTRQVIEEYNKLVTAQKVLKIKAESKENQMTLLESAEMQFKQGNLSLDEYSQMQLLSSNSQAEYEAALGNYRTLYRQFEELLGMELTKLLRK